MANEKNLITTRETEVNNGVIMGSLNMTENILKKYSTGLVNLTAGTARLETTGSKPERIADGSAFWAPFGGGDKTASTADATLFPFTAMRLVITSGTWRFELTGDFS